MVSLLTILWHSLPASWYQSVPDWWRILYWMRLSVPPSEDYVLTISLTVVVTKTAIGKHRHVRTFISSCSWPPIAHTLLSVRKTCTLSKLRVFSFPVYLDLLTTLCLCLPIHEACTMSMVISESAAFNCGMATALKPNTRPVLRVPVFAMNAATIWRNALPRSCFSVRSALTPFSSSAFGTVVWP